MTIPLRDIEARVPHRSAGYREEVLSHGQVVGDTLEMADEIYAELVAKYRGARPPAIDTIYAARLAVCRGCIDEVCCRCPNTEIERRAADGGCPLGLWPAGMVAEQVQKP